MVAKYDLKNIGGIENAMNHTPPHITILLSPRITLNVTAAKTANKITPDINPVLSKKGNVHKLYGKKNLQNIMGITGRFLIKGIIPKIFEEGLTFITLCLSNKKKTKNINQTVRNGIISFNTNFSFWTK